MKKYSEIEIAEGINNREYLLESVFMCNPILSYDSTTGIIYIIF